MKALRVPDIFQDNYSSIICDKYVNLYNRDKSEQKSSSLQKFGLAERAYTARLAELEKQRGLIDWSAIPDDTSEPLKHSMTMIRLSLEDHGEPSWLLKKDDTNIAALPFGIANPRAWLKDVAENISQGHAFQEWYNMALELTKLLNLNPADQKAIEFHFRVVIEIAEIGYHLDWISILTREILARDFPKSLPEWKMRAPESKQCNSGQFSGPDPATIDRFRHRYDELLACGDKRYKSKLAKEFGKSEKTIGRWIDKIY